MQNSFIIANLISSKLCIFQHLHRDSENRKKKKSRIFSDSCSSPHAPRALAQLPSDRVPST